MKLATRSTRHQFARASTLILLVASACSSKTSSDGGKSAVGGSAGDAGSNSAATGGIAGNPAASGGSATGGVAGNPAATGGGASGSGTPSGGAAGIGGGFSFAGMGSVPTVVDGQVYCGTEVCVCNDGLDNDGDGTIDGFDPECTGAYDDDEGSFATGIPGDNSDQKWQDCFFDGNSGAGDDGCRYSTDCMTGDLPMTDPDCTLAADCIDFCAVRSPPGCDCFGCCEIRDTDNITRFVQIGGGCDYESIDSCAECIQTTACGNDCGECELCLGKTIDDLPASCFGTGGGGSGGSSSGSGGSSSSSGGSSGSSGGSGGVAGAPGSGGSSVTPPPNTCDTGKQACNADWPCSGSEFCMQGCCFGIF